MDLFLKSNTFMSGFPDFVAEMHYCFFLLSIFSSRAALSSAICSSVNSTFSLSSDSEMAEPQGHAVGRVCEEYVDGGVEPPLALWPVLRGAGLGNGRQPTEQYRQRHRPTAANNYQCRRHPHHLAARPAGSHEMHLYRRERRHRHLRPHRHPQHHRPCDGTGLQQGRHHLIPSQGLHP